MSKRVVRFKSGPYEAMPQSGHRSDAENRSKARSHILATIKCLEGAQEVTKHALLHARRVFERVEGERTQDF